MRQLECYLNREFQELVKFLAPVASWISWRRIEVYPYCHSMWHGVFVLWGRGERGHVLFSVGCWG
jgi:hypothetical protein